MANYLLRRTRLRLAGYQRLVRLPNLLMLALCQALVYWFLVPAAVRYAAPAYHIALLIFSTLSIAAAGYVINDYYDIKIDSINKPLRVIIGRHITRREAMLLHLVLTFLGIAAGFLLSWQMAVINAGVAFLLWWYSHQLKRTLLAGNIAIAMLTTISILVVGYHFRTLSLLLFGYAVFAFLLSLIREIIKDMEDMKGDARFDCYTLPIAIGVANTKWVLLGLLVSYFVLLGLLVPLVHWPLRLYGLLLIVLPSVYLVFGLYRADKKRDFRQLSFLCKIIMLAGVLSMVLV